MSWGVGEGRGSWDPLLLRGPKMKIAILNLFKCSANGLGRVEA